MLIVTMTSAWITQWAMLLTLRTWEEHAFAMSDDMRQDRSALPLAVFSVPSAFLVGGVWLLCYSVGALH